MPKAARFSSTKKKLPPATILFVPALIFHEALRVARQQEDWSHFPLIDKLFENKFAYLALEGNDLYGMNPVEHHAYRMDEAVAGFLLDKMQIKFIENDCPPADAFPRFAAKTFFPAAKKRQISTNSEKGF